jgi:Uncharacterized conserved protein
MAVKSPKEAALDRRLLELMPRELGPLADQILFDPEIKALQDYANTVSIRRLGYNDHGPVHMRKVVKSALKMAAILHRAGIPLSLEADEVGSWHDSLVVLFLAGMLHDIGMSVTRQDHENYSATLALPIIDRYLAQYAEDDIERRVRLRSMVVECIVGHMGMIRVHSREAGLILVADGSDMEKGRARIPMLINTEARVGDIHKYSSSAVERITITEGQERPIRISIDMTESVGFFQVEEVLFPKLSVSPAKPFIEIYAQIAGGDVKRYA